MCRRRQGKSILILSMTSTPLILFGAVGVIVLAVALFGWSLNRRTIRRSHAEGEQLVSEIDALLPQTQCRQCGYAGCRPYARAIVEGGADINQCPPGGDRGIKALAALLGRKRKPLNATHGMEKPAAVAYIEENRCIGCTLCTQACPVDAIVGAAKQMHTIVADLCTGCELCVPPCPVDCIRMLPAPVFETGEPRQYRIFELLALPQSRQKAAAARERHEYRLFREEREKNEKASRLAAKTTAPGGLSTGTAGLTGAPAGLAEDQKKALIAAAIARAQLQKAQVQPSNTEQLTATQLAKLDEIEARRAGESTVAKPAAQDRS